VARSNLGQASMARRALIRGDTLPLLLRLWRDWLRPHAATLAVVLVLIVVVGGATGFYPALIKTAFDAFDAKDAAALAYAPVLVVAVTALRGFALFAQTVLTNRVVTRVEADMQAALYGHMIEADLAQLGRESPASLTQRFTTDFAFIKEALTRISTVLLRDVAMLLALACAMLWMDPWLTLGAAVVVPLVAQPIARIGRKLRRVSTSTQEQVGATASLISESLAGARVAKTYGLEGYLKARTAAALDEVRRLKMKAANARGRLDPLLEIGGGLAVAGVLLLIGQRILSGEKTVGDFTGYVAALLLAAQPARALGNLNAILQEAMAALARTFALMDEAPRIREAQGARPLAVAGGEIRLEGVCFRYRDDQPALEGIDLVVPGGATTALVGRSGSGKSTLLSLVPRLYDVGAGRLLIDGLAAATAR
jgi:subfamily B ATP-binding cassette protein MsbA